MPRTAPKARLARPTSPAWTAAATLLLTSAGVAAVAEPLAVLRKPAEPPTPGKASQPVRAATVRIVLPPVSFAPIAPQRSPGTVRIVLNALDAADPDAADPHAAALAAATIKPPVSATIIAPQPVIEPADPEQNLAVARAREMTVYSPARYETADVAKPESMSMVGDENWAALTRSYDTSAAPASATDRTKALRPPAPSQSLVAVGPLEDEAGPAPRFGVDAPASKRPAFDTVSLQVSARVNGAAAGRVSLMIRDQDNISIRLADVLGILRPAIDPTLYDRLSGSTRSYMTFNELRAAGVTVDFDKRDRLILSTP